MFRKLHSEYVDVVSNPFHIPGEPICSKSVVGYIFIFIYLLVYLCFRTFDATVKSIMTKS